MQNNTVTPVPGWVKRKPSLVSDHMQPHMNAASLVSLSNIDNLRPGRNAENHGQDLYYFTLFIFVCSSKTG